MVLEKFLIVYSSESCRGSRIARSYDYVNFKPGRLKAESSFASSDRIQIYFAHVAHGLHLRPLHSIRISTSTAHVIVNYRRRVQCVCPGPGRAACSHMASPPHALSGR